MTIEETIRAVVREELKPLLERLGPPVYGVGDVARMCNRAEETVCRWIHVKKLHATRPAGRRWVIALEDFHDFLRTDSLFGSPRGRRR